ncbi:MAG: T9SS type A sorting domain-containing protein [Agriterribacter sp.]
MKKISTLTLVLCLALSKIDAQVLSQDSLALVNIYNTTNGNAWTQKWDRSQPVSTWFGVTVTSGRVTALSLPNNNLTGKLLSGTVAKLTGLKVLQLQNNQIGDGLPGGIGSLTNLELLDLSFNNLSGNILSSFFNNLPNLQQFNVANNDLRGWIPANISNSTALTEINLSNNRFSNKIPASINNLTNLTKFLVANNDLVGPMPAGILCSASIQVNISGNGFTFSGVECLGSNPNAVYGNQRNLTLGQAGLKLTAAAGGTLTNNTYTWYRYSPDESYIPYYISSNASIPSLNVIETGTYWVEVTNNQLPGLTLRSDSVTITDVSSLRQQDSIALVDLYNSTKGAQWINKTNWLTNTPLQNWYGVDIENGRVANLYLNENNLDGKIPSTIKYLTALRNVELIKNKLTGRLPEIHRSLQLNTIVLSDNSFYGELPAAWGNLSHLSAIDLNSNQLTGSIPESFGKLDLLFLYLANNKLSGTIPASVAAVEYWDARFDRNSFTGPVPPGFCANSAGGSSIEYNRFNFSGLECLASPESFDALYYAHQAPIPIINENPVLKVAAGGTVTNNTYKWYKDNTLVATKTGDSTYTMLTSGNYHAIITNSLATELTLSSDTMFFNVTAGIMQDSLALVDFHHNITSGLNWVLTDPINTWEGVIIRDGRVKELYTEQLSGTLSPAIGNLSELTALYIGYFSPNENLTGNLPSTIANLAKLEELAIHTSNITGSIPDDLGRNQPNLRFISIGGKYLTGTIPSGLEYATKLGELFLGGEISGAIPTFFKKLPLWELSLQGNKLTGSIPDSLSSSDYGMPAYLNLSHNLLSGQIPNWTYGPVALDLSNNQLSGPLPDSVFRLGVWVNLSHNKFTGVIPKIPESITSLNLSHNLFESVDPVDCGTTLDLSYGYDFELNNNRLNFTGLECLSTISVIGPGSFIFNPQQHIPIINENPVLKAAAGGTIADNTYKWYKNGALVATIAGDPSFVISSVGTYHCVVTNSNVPGVELRTDSVDISTVSSRKVPGLANGTTGTDNGKLSVYPNPANTGFIYIKGLQKAESVLLYNTAGQLVKQWQNINGNQQLNIGELAKGMYMVKIVEKDRQTTLKFIKE